MTEKEMSEAERRFKEWEERRAMSKEAFAKLDPGDLEAAIELGDLVCKDLGICCTEKGKVMFNIYRQFKSLGQGEKQEVAEWVKEKTEEVIESGKGGVPSEEHLAEGRSEGSPDRVGEEA